MKKIIGVYLFVVLMIQANGQNNYAIIPQPAKLIPAAGQFTFKKNTSIIVTKGADSFVAVAKMLSNQINSSFGINLSIKTGNVKPNAVNFIFNNQLAEEGYQLSVNDNKIDIQAKTGKGAFYALQTLFQLMPAQVFSTSPSNQIATALACSIEDAPRFNYRGLMLDAGRNFFPVSFIKRYIDLMAVYKLNTFHWHLTEDQGWRIEIKKYPLLTSISSIRKESMVGKYDDMKFDKTPYGGFYTQEDIKEVVAYADKKFITIIPEIEMPGHSQALLAAYPQLGCNPDKIYEVATLWGVSEDVLCPREETFTFMENVLTEVMALFPGKYIHVGGDECPKTQWKQSRFCQDLIKKLGLKNEHELQSYFMGRIDKFLTSNGKRMLGWDEILEGGLSPNAMVMSWRGTSGGIEAAKLNHDVVMSPNDFFYLDYYQGNPKTEPIAIGGFLPLSKCYSFEPDLPELNEAQTKHIIGIQANVWTEYINTNAYAEYMTFPRALALAEIAWSPKAPKNYSEFVQRVQKQKPNMDALKINYCPVELK
jgi:hexosaminidase